MTSVLETGLRPNTGGDMKTPRNTSKEHPGDLVGIAMMKGSSQSIEDMEAQGQRELVESDVLPIEVVRGTDTEFEALGFTFGDPVPDDDLFRAATLPSGWKREGSDHSMWSHIVDETGRKRVSIFYKAAFYDRRAFMALEDD